MFAELPIGRPHDGCDPDEQEPCAVRFLRLFGIVGMTVVVVLIAANEPHPGFAGERLVVTVGLVALAAGILVGQPQRVLPPGVRLAAVLAVTFGALAVMTQQPEGAAVGGLYFAVVVAALRLPRPLAIAILLLAVSGSGVAAELSDSDMDPVGMAVGLFFALVPWLLVLGLVRDLARGREELRASRAAEAEAAAQAERGRLAREMHDVLAHSLSGLALQLEGARLLARDRDTDPAVVEAIERARHLATSGLDEARGAIAALRGDELPGPERLPLLAEAFAAHSDATCALRVHGDPPALTSEARVALYRTAQEALTNVRKHAAARHVDVDLTYATRRRDARGAGPRGGRAGGGRCGGRRARCGAGAGRRLRADRDARAGRARRWPAHCRPDGRRVPRRAVGAGVSGAPPPVRVLLADDQRVVRDGLAMLLGLLDGIELVATAADGEEALAGVAEHDPDVVLMDLRMPRLDGIEATRRLGERGGGRPRVVALTTYADDASVLGALRAGAKGYLTKDAGADEIRDAVLAVARGEAALDPAVQHHVVSALAGGAATTEPARPALPDDLTPREAEVLTLIATGLTNTEIADRLVVSPATVKSHVNHLFAKIGARDRGQAVAYAFRNGLA